MLNVFDIFKMLIGIVIFVLLITLFLRFAGGYTDLSQTGQEYEAANAFDTLLRNTYTSGNPGEFDGFGNVEYVTFDPPDEPRPSDNAKIRFPAGQKTLSVPAFVMTGEGKMSASRICDNYGWFSFCYVMSAPVGDTVLFSLNWTPQRGNVIRGVVECLPPGMTVGYCDADAFLIPAGDWKENRGEFLRYVGNDYNVSPCTDEIPEGYWLVAFNADRPEERTVNVSGATVMDSAGVVNSIIQYSDVTIALCGPGSLENKRAMLERELSVAASVMHDRSVMVHEGMQQNNEEPCRGCPTPYPKACGYKEYDVYGDGAEQQSVLYEAFIYSLSTLEEILAEHHSHRDVINSLAPTVTSYEALKDGGCE